MSRSPANDAQRPNPDAIRAPIGKGIREAARPFGRSRGTSGRRLTIPQIRLLDVYNMPALVPTAKLTRAPDVLFSPLANDEGVLLSMEAGLYFSLNRTAVAVWNAMERDQSVSELVSLLTGKFKVTSEQATQDLQALLTQMIEKKLVVQKS
jgi:hypothetical protein